MRISGVVLSRQIASITRAIGKDGAVIEYPEPLLKINEVVYRPDEDPAPIIVVRLTVE